MSSKVSKSVYIALGVALVVGFLLWIPNRKTATYTPKNSTPTASSPMFGRKDSTIVSRTDFVTTLFQKVRIPAFVMSYLESSKIDADSAEKVKKWAVDTRDARFFPLVAMVQVDLARGKGKVEAYASASLTSMNLAIQQEDETVKTYLWQMVKECADSMVLLEPKGLRGRNALAVYTSEFENQPMQAVGLLRQNLALDSNDIETNVIYLRLLKKSQQWNKALQKSLKLVSLQPQNPDFLFETSDIYGNLGDKANAQLYLELGVKAQKKQEKK